MSNFFKKISKMIGGNRVEGRLRFRRRNGRESFRADTSSLRIEVLEDRSLLAANLVKDIFPGSSSSNLSGLTNVNETLYFRADDGVNGFELWKSNGTAAGTVLVKDIQSGSGSSFPQFMTNVNGTLYFSAADSANGTELWKSDGTAAGTVIVKNIQSGSGSSVPNSLTNVNGTLYFRANDGTNGDELWKSDGTAAGTVLVKDIQSGIGASSPRYLTNVNGRLYFRANDGVNGEELWKSDGTAAGTVLVKDIRSGGNSDPRYLTDINGTLYFFANDFTNGEELWKTDGTAAGTALVKDIATGASGSGLRWLTNVNGTAYFGASDLMNGIELWKSDGTIAGTLMVKDIEPGSGHSNLGILTNVNGTLYFNATTSASGAELWKSDGTTAGTVLVKDIRSGSGNSNPNFLTNVNGWLGFQANDGINGAELWVSDGTPQGTRMQADISGGSGSSSPGPFVNTGSQLFFQATSAGIGAELWRFDTLQSSNTSLSAGIVTVDLLGSTANRSLSVRMTAGGLALHDLISDTDVLGPNSELPINGVQGFRIIGSSAFSENITIDHSFGGVVDLPKGIQFDGGAGGTDTVSIIGATGVDAIMSQTSTDVNITSGVSIAGVTLQYRNVESLTMTGMRRITVGGNLNIDIPISVSHQLPLDLGGITTFAGGSLTSNGLVSLGSAESIIGSGTVSGRFSGEAGSAILATGNMTIGSSVSVAGFLTRGELDAGTATVTLLDANQAVLGSLTSLGNTTTIGTLVAANGALIDFGNNLIGNGTLNSPNLALKPTIINGNIEGTSLAKPITLSGYIKGVGSLNNVSVTGTYSPGFSPAAVTLGSVSYAASAVTVVELGGTVPGTQHDQLNHFGQALLGGILDLEFINGYQPAIGSSFTILTATGGISGTFASTQLPSLASGLEWLIAYNAQSVVVSVIQSNLAPTDLVLSSTTIAENRPANSLVGMFTTTDPNVGDTHTYSLVAGIGSTDNAAFAVSGNQLAANSSFDFESRNSYSIRVRTTDALGLIFEKTFTINVTDVNEPVVVTRANANVSGNVLTQLTNTGTWSDPESGTVTLSASLGTVTKNTDGTWNWTYQPIVGVLGQLVTISATDGTNVSMTTFNMTAYTTVATRGLAYVGATGTSASTSLATDKAALLPGQSSTFANYTNYSRGLNGLVIDVSGAAPLVAAAPGLKSDAIRSVSNDPPLEKITNTEVLIGASLNRPQSLDRVLVDWKGDERQVIDIALREIAYELGNIRDNFQSLNKKDTPR